MYIYNYEPFLMVILNDILVDTDFELSVYNNFHLQLIVTDIALSVPKFSRHKKN